VQSGGVTKASTVSHGLLILLSIISIPFVLNLIPLATLASILLLVGYKLAKPALFVKIYKQGFEQFVPFVATIVAIVTTDLLIGLGIGLLISVLIILYNSFKMPYMIQNKNEESIKIELAQEVTFLNKAAIQKALGDIPANSKVEIDISKTAYMHHDVKELIDNFKVNSQGKNIQVQLVPTEIEEKVEVF
jgi:MFS superfamily sulfate permease-like transporter